MSMAENLAEEGFEYRSVHAAMLHFRFVADDAAFLLTCRFLF